MHIFWLYLFVDKRHFLNQVTTKNSLYSKGSINALSMKQILLLTIAVDITFLSDHSNTLLRSWKWPVCHMLIRHNWFAICQFPLVVKQTSYGKLAHMANWLVWQTDNGKLAMANWHMANRYMTKHCIPIYESPVIDINVNNVLIAYRFPFYSLLGSFCCITSSLSSSFGKTTSHNPLTLYFSDCVRD